jgi:hypothetical protein
MPAMAKPLAKLVALLTPKRRWAQFSLKSLLILTAVIGIGLGILSYRHAVQQRDIAMIREMGGDASVEASGPGWLRWLIGDKFFEHVVGAELQGSRITDETLAVVARFPDLKGLSVINAAITDSGFAQLHRLHRLEILYMESVQITDAGLMHLTEVPSLVELRVATGTIPGITVNGLKKLQQASPTLKVVEGMYL